MIGTIIDNLSERKLNVLWSFLLLCQVACFLLGGRNDSIATTSETCVSTVCKDTDNNTNTWFYGRGNGKCRNIDLRNDNVLPLAEDIVFTFQLPLAREAHIVKYSRWTQKFIHFLQLDAMWRKSLRPGGLVTVDARVAYRNKGDPDDAWKLYAQTLETRAVDCEHIRNIFAWLSCSVIPLYQFGSLHHDYYLINVRLPAGRHTNLDINPLVALMQDQLLTATHQNGRFTKLLISFKAVFSSIVAAVMLWFWLRVLKLKRKSVLIEKMLLGLGFTLFLLNLPFEFLTLFNDRPFMLLLSDIRQGLFYVVLFAFWLIFAGEHMLIKEDSSLMQYWREVSVIVIVCVPFFALNAWKCAMLHRNPLYFIENNLAPTFVILDDIIAGAYFLFLSYMIWQAFCNIAEARASLHTNCSIRIPQFEKIGTTVSADSIKKIGYRFKFLMLVMLLCAAITVINIVLGSIMQTKLNTWSDKMEKTSAFFIGVYGLLNIYISAMMVLYAPRDKHLNVAEIVFTVSLGKELETSCLPSEGTTATEPPMKKAFLTLFKKSLMLLKNKTTDIFQ